MVAAAVVVRWLWGVPVEGAQAALQKVRGRPDSWRPTGEDKKNIGQNASSQGLQHCCNARARTTNAALVLGQGGSSGGAHNTEHMETGAGAGGEIDGAGAGSVARWHPPAVPEDGNTWTGARTRSRTRGAAVMPEMSPPSPASSPPPSPPLLDLVQKHPDLFEVEVLARLDPADRAVLAQVGWPWQRAVVRAAGPGRRDPLQIAGKSAGVPLMVGDFVGSVKRLAWAKANGCPWEARTCADAVLGGHMQSKRNLQLESLMVAARRHFSKAAVGGGNLEVLKWVREHDCPWDEGTCA